jgi:hypothetical protein
MEDKVLKCPSCSGQMMLTEAKPGDKIAKCKYCDTIVDLPDTAEKQGFDLNDFFKGFNIDGLKNGTGSTTTITTTTIIMKDGKVVSSTDKDEVNKKLKILKDALNKSRLNISGLTDKDETVDGDFNISE